MTPENIDITIGRHDERLYTLEGKVEKMETCVEAIKTNVNRILGGVAISCILLVVNIIYMLAIGR